MLLRLPRLLRDRLSKAQPPRQVTTRLGALSAAFLVVGLPPWARVDQSAAIRVDPASTYQTIVAWEATAQAGETDSPLFPTYRDFLFDQAANDLRVNRLRVEIRATAGSFNLQELDQTIESLVLPLRQRLQARGERLLVNICYVNKPQAGGLASNPQQYAQQVLRVYQHLQSQYGFVPDAWEIGLEPNVFGWGAPADVARDMNAAGDLLQANGYTPYFIAPSNSDTGSALGWFDGMLREVPDATRYLREYAYHRYSWSTEHLQSIALRAQTSGIRTAMLEHIGADVDELYTDLTVANVSAWQQYTLAFPAAYDDGAQYFWIDQRQTDPARIVVVPKRTQLLRQYFAYVRPGAVRVSASSPDGSLAPAAFINADGSPVVVVRARTAGTFSVQGLAPGVYESTYTTAHADQALGPASTVEGGTPLTASIPEAGVVTIYRRAPSPPPPPVTPAVATVTDAQPTDTEVGPVPDEEPPVDPELPLREATDVDAVAQ